MSRKKSGDFKEVEIWQIQWFQLIIYLSVLYSGLTGLLGGVPLVQEFSLNYITGAITVGFAAVFITFVPFPIEGQKWIKKFKVLQKEVKQ